MTNFEVGQEMSEDQAGFKNLSIGVGDKVQVSYNGGKVVGVVDWAEMANNHQIFNVKVEVNGKSKIIEDLGLKDIKKLDDSLEENTLP